jgi:hypothetical protein
MADDAGVLGFSVGEDEIKWEWRDSLLGVSLYSDTDDSSGFDLPCYQDCICQRLRSRLESQQTYLDRSRQSSRATTWRRHGIEDDHAS